MRLSILMPTYNGIKFLKEAVDSVFAQNHQDWELIISDDGSTDGTRDYLASLRDPRVKIHFQPANLNIFGNLNFLFTQSSADLTQILCQDDFFLDNGSLNRLLQQWRDLPPGVVFLRANHLYGANQRLARYEGSALPSIVAPERSDLLFFLFGCIPGNLSNVLVRTEAVRNAGWFRTDLPYAGDFEFWSRLGRYHPWAISRAEITFVRSHSGQASAFLNREGEVLPQTRLIVNTLYRNLTASGYSPATLRLLGTINYVCQQRERGIKAILRGQGAQYLRRVLSEYDSSDFAFGPFLSWLVFFLSLGGRKFRIPIAARLLRKNPSTRPPAQAKTTA